VHVIQVGADLRGATSHVRRRDGTYWLAACEDANADDRYDDEPALTPDPDKPVTLAPGQSVEGLKLVIPRQGRFEGSCTIADLQTRDSAEQQRVSAFKMSVAGAVAALDETHTSILESAAVAARLNEILAGTRPSNPVVKVLTLGLAGNKNPVPSHPSR
jgi:hypothetical protein